MDALLFCLCLVKILIVFIILRFVVWCVFLGVDWFLGVNVTISGPRLLGFRHLSIKSQKLDLQINNFYVTLRWFDPSCRHFFKFNIAGVHVEYYSTGPGDSDQLISTNSRETIHGNKTRKGPSRKRRFLYWCVQKILKLTELSVQCLEVLIQDKSKTDISLVMACKVARSLSVIAQPLPHGELGLSLQVDKLAAQFLLQTDRPCTSTDDGMYPLADLKLSAKAVIILKPLTLEGSLVRTVQLNIIPVSVSLIQQDLISQVLVDYDIVTLSQTSAIGTVETEDSLKSHIQQKVSLLPEKMEVVLEDVDLLFHATSSNRVISSKLTRFSVATNIVKKDNCVMSADSGLPLCDLTVGVYELSLLDSHSRKALRLHQFRLTCEISSKSLTNKAHIDSLHVCLWEKETVYWNKFVQKSINKLKAKLKMAASSSRDVDKLDNSALEEHKRTLGGLKFISQIFNLPLSVVTTIEASDWSAQLHMDSPSLQSKEPFCCVGMATCAACIHWNELDDEQDSNAVRSSLRLADAYLHVPGYHPTVDNPTFYRQRIDNPQVFPSLHTHLWGRVVSIGNFTLKAEKEVELKHRTDETSDEDVCVQLTSDPLRIDGEGSCLMVEWSQPTVVAVAKFFDHLIHEYDLKMDNNSCTEEDEEANNNKTLNEFKELNSWSRRLDIRLQLTDINLFVCSLTPEPPAIVIRLDACSISSSSFPSLSLSLHNFLLDDMHLPSFEQVFVCSDVANLPYGAGVVCVTTAGIDYDHQIQDASINCAKLSFNWTTTSHRCLFRVATYFLEDIKLLTGVLDQRKNTTNKPSPTSESPCEPLAISEVMESYLKRIPLSVVVRIETAECIAQMDKKTKVSLELNNVQSTVTGGVVLFSSQEIDVSFDKRHIISLLEALMRFPHTDNKLDSKRKRLKFKLERDRNPILWLQASRADFIFPYDYNFSLTYDKMLNVKKFLQKIHGRPQLIVGASRSYLLPDVLIECEDILLQVDDDPFEIKLRANYELLCDELEQKTQRVDALKMKLDQIIQQDGVIAVSGEKVQSLYNSLEVKDSEIYCQRAKQLYSSQEATRAGFIFTMEHSQLLVMFDPSMLGEERLVTNLKEIDAISALPPDYSFSTLWGCYVDGSTDKLQIQLRDYPIPLLAITEITASGRMVFAEQEAQIREQRSAVVEVGHPWSNVTIKRKLPPLKYYYDLEMTSETWDMSYGPCFEPALAQTNIGFGRVTSPTIDQSKNIPYWDKLRLLFHGPIHLLTNEMRVLLPATFNPYNSVEYLEIRLCKLDVDLLTNTQLGLEGALHVIVHTASKYNDCEILTFPHAKSCLKLNWYCGGKDPNGHHYVVRCAPDRAPVLPDNQVHDSYSSFRSQNLDVEWSLDVQPKRETDTFPPSLFLYSSTLRCLQQYQTLQKWNVTRPIRRGTYYKNLKPRRPPLLRHTRELKVSVSFPQSIFHYWSSVALHRGIECTIDHARLSMNYLVKLVPVDSNLIQRPKANWTIVGCLGKVKNLVAHVKQRIERKDLESEAVMSEPSADQNKDHIQTILLTLEELSYTTQGTESIKENSEDDFTHQLETQNTKLLWNPSNKSVCLGLYDAFNQAQLLKRDLSADALKSVKFDTIPLEEPILPPENGDAATASESTSSPRHSRLRHQSSGNTMLDQLLADISNKFVSYVDERAPSDPLLKGVAAGSMNDVSKRNWMITLTNTQVALQGPDKNGYILASSHVAQVFGREHHPQVKDGHYVSKKSWVGKIQELQYFSTVWMVTDQVADLKIPWLPFSVIRPPLALIYNDLNDEQPHTDDEASLNVLLSKLGPEGGLNIGNTSSLRPPPGEAVGGLVSCILTPDNFKEDPQGSLQRQSSIQLQRIASRCHCQIFHVTYGEVVESEVSTAVPKASASPQGSNDFKLSSKETVDTLTMRYPSVDVCTTSSQYALIMDIVNNLLLNKEAKKKEALDRNARMQFTLQLASYIQDPRIPVQVQQNRVRKSIQKLIGLETRLFLEQREDLRSEGRETELKCNIVSAKEEVSMASNTLRSMIRAFKQSQLYMTPTRGPHDSEPADPIRRIEIWVDDAHWWLTQDDGQLQVAEICFTNFSYNRMTFSNDSGEHRLELGTFNVCNLMPNTRSLYKRVLHPYDPNEKHLRVDKNICLRVYCKDKAPVAGISVTEHLEVNVVPLSVSLTAKFYQTMQDFFFPKADERTSDLQDPDHSHMFAPSGIQSGPVHTDTINSNSPLLSRSSSLHRSAMSVNSSASVASTTTIGHSPPSSPQPKETSSKGKNVKVSAVDAVEKMKERATHIKTFIYIKIPQCSLCVNYKSENVSLKDIQNGRFTLPTLEYHNKNWTWTDMLMEVKKYIKTVIVQQTLKSVVGMKETDETAGLASPKLKRHASDLLLGRIMSVKTGKGRKLFRKQDSKDDIETDRARKYMHNSSEATVTNNTSAYQPPLSEPEMKLKRTAKPHPTNDS